MNARAPELRAVIAGVEDARHTEPRKGFWARVFDKIVESRTRRARRELAEHLPLIRDILARRRAEEARALREQYREKNKGGGPAATAPSVVPFPRRDAA